MDTTSNLPSEAPASQPTARRPYEAPALRCYGDVVSLTRGSGGTAADGVMNDKK